VRKTVCHVSRTGRVHATCASRGKASPPTTLARSVLTIAIAVVFRVQAAATYATRDTASLHPTFAACATTTPLEI